MLCSILCTRAQHLARPKHLVTEKTWHPMSVDPGRALGVRVDHLVQNPWSKGFKTQPPWKQHKGLNPSFQLSQLSAM